MKNNQLYPFERNRYYSGKMLTSADFQAEQTYFNNKRRFINHMVFGSGIICGCGVFSLDDLSLLVESGVAIDGMGREIVIDTSVVKKLSAIEGFEQLQTNEASLCLRYLEQPVHSVYSIDKQDRAEEYEYNRISEGYELFLTDSENVNQEFKMESEFLTRGALYENQDYRVEVVMPATACTGRNVRMQIVVTKLSAENVKFSIQAVLQVPSFTTETGSHEISFSIDNLNLTKDGVFTKNIWLKAQDVAALDTNVVLKSGTGFVNYADHKESLSSGFSLKVVIANETPRNLIARELGKMSLEMKNMSGNEEYVRLADLRLVRTDTAYIIEEIRENAVKSYIPTVADAIERNEYLDFFEKKDVVGTTEVSSSGHGGSDFFEVTPDRVMPEIATGVLEIPISEKTKKGNIYYSGEIMHGLGSGNVYVEIGYESMKEDQAIGASTRTTIYGNPDFFRNSEGDLSNVETAVKVFNDKGSFMVAAKVPADTNYLVLSYRWVAIKFPSTDEYNQFTDIENKSIIAETPTVVLGTRDSYYFNVKFQNMETCSIVYELTEANSGEITAEGVYTAPAKEGVYEIRISCADMPMISTYAYAIVKKKGLETEE